MANEPIDNNAEDLEIEKDDYREEDKGGEAVEFTPTESKQRVARHHTRPVARPAGVAGDNVAGPRRVGRFQPRRKVCAFCIDKTKSINWKEVDGLRRFVSENGSIRPRRKTGTCARHQRRLAVAIKRARTIALLPYTNEHVRLTSKR